MNPLTDEQQKDISERKELFIKEYEALTEKYHIEHASGPTLTNVGPNLFAITMISDIRDTKYLPTPSPLRA